MNKISKVLFAIAAICMLFTVAYYVFNHVIDTPFTGDSVLQGKSETQNESETQSGSDTQLPVSANGIGILPYSKNLKEPGQYFELLEGDQNSGLQCSVNKVVFTKNSIDTDAVYAAKDDRSNPIQFDGNGNILNDFMYVSVNVTLENTSNKEVEIYMNRFQCVVIDPKTKDSADIYYNGELRGYKTQKEKREYNKSYARKVILPGEKFISDLVYIERESEIKDRSVYVKYFCSGVTNPEYDKGSVYVRLKE